MKKYCVARIRKHLSEQADVIRLGGVLWLQTHGEWSKTASDAAEYSADDINEIVSEERGAYPEDEIYAIASDDAHNVEDPALCDFDGYDGDEDDEDAIEAYRITCEEEFVRNLS